MSLFSPKYKVNYNGQKDSFQGARDSYRVGERVRLYYGFVATDTDYSFYVDGERYNALWGDRGYEISFVMPDHDVDVRVESRNSMMYLENETE